MALVKGPKPPREVQNAARAAEMSVTSDMNSISNLYRLWQLYLKSSIRLDSMCSTTVSVYCPYLM